MGWKQVISEFGQVRDEIYVSLDIKRVKRSFILDG